MPLHKKGNYNNADNFGVIILLSVLGKLYTRVLNNWLDKWAESYRIYIEAQFGFRKGRSTVDCVFILQGLIQKFLRSGIKLYAFFVDYSKAFDYIVRNNLWFKLITNGVRGKSLDIIMSMYRS